MRATKDTLDFIVVGAQKAGTTSLFEYLRRHPELCLPAGKEAPFFSHDAMWPGGWDGYIKRHFAAVDSARKCGTITPHYMFGAIYDVTGRLIADSAGCDEHTVPLRIYERLPAARLIAVLRDPVDRAYSHHRMSWMNRLDRRSFDEAIEELLLPHTLDRSRRHPEENTSYVVRGEYGRILKGYFDVFPRAQMLVVFTHELESEPEQLLRRVHEFLGVAPDVLPDNLGAKYRQGLAERRFYWLNAYAARDIVVRNVRARFLWQALPESSRFWIDRRFAAAAYRLDLWNRRTAASLASPKQATLVRLRGHYSDDRRQLTGMLGQEPPWPDSSVTR